ncbi:NAD dependent epimerase/dehydratase family protein [Desulfitobacterium hafniense DP7]|uniref:Nucleoside-diphosphate-sugar epimerase n=2 Tax=Desulfitobacterium hafniense TaxID=49338 RepID=A0A098B8K5_DESHA|nr:NAD(P)-dependent oxidoreductase [Desulfitobacterium hafniense]EHL09177.1 NAD dependent epimerase/dehydratase family protein [Desulfitobacterium hafniense DP7]CDX04690.1 Nucleoside-diphosphate-sugar epimerase [Desulfitobacterium hafniense]
MAKVLVTGSKGTLGTRLVEELRKRGHEVWEVDLQHDAEEKYFRADIAKYRQLERVFEQDYDYVYHLAAEFGRINGEHYYDTLWETNVIGTRNILEWQLKKGFKLIFTSSSEIYGEAQEPLLTEDLPQQKTIIQHNDYALTKWANEVQIINFEKRYETPIVRLRLFNAYGPGEYYHPYRSVVCLFVYRALKGIPYDVYEGYHRVFMYVDDLIPTIANVGNNFKPGEVYNIGGTEYRSVRELSDLVLKYTQGDPGLIRYLPEDRHNTVSKRPDIQKAVRDLGHNPKMLLEEGIPITVEWMKKIYGEGR